MYRSTLIYEKYPNEIWWSVAFIGEVDKTPLKYYELHDCAAFPLNSLLLLLCIRNGRGAVRGHGKEIKVHNRKVNMLKRRHLTHALLDFIVTIISQSEVFSLSVCLFPCFILFANWKEMKGLGNDNKTVASCFSLASHTAFSDEN